jgi:hypothetical protein
MKLAWKWGIAAAMLALATACVIGGREADPEDWPGVVSLQSQQGRNIYHECGAAMISPEWALTAAHCMETVRIDADLGRAVQYLPDGRGALKKFGPLLACGRRRDASGDAERCNLSGRPDCHAPRL